MKRKLSTILTILMIVVLTVSTADAGGGIKIPSANFSLGSLIADGLLQGTGQADVTVLLEATGNCTIGETPVEVSAAGTQFLPGITESGTKKKDNKREFHVETNVQVGDDGVCHNNPSDPEDPDDQDGFIFWTGATISVYSGQVGVCDVTTLCDDGGIDLRSSIAATDDGLLVQQAYNCTTDQDAFTVSCTPVRNNGANGPNNGGFAICHATGNTKNPYVLLTVNGNGLSGHSQHSGDIIPAPADGCPQ